MELDLEVKSTVYFGDYIDIVRVSYVLDQLLLTRTRVECRIVAARQTGSPVGKYWEILSNG